MTDNKDSVRHSNKIQEDSKEFGEYTNLNQNKICGLSKCRFYALIIVMVAAIAGGVTAFVISNNNADPDSPPSPPEPPLNPEKLGYYSWSWNPFGGQDEANIGVAFSGYVDVPTAISESAGSMSSLIHYGRDGPWITIGGGNEHGNFTAEAI
jgi:hypothetical protein